MYHKTTNPYQFKYLRTGIKGPGIKEVYLPTQPPPEQIAGYDLPQKKQKFYKTQIPKDYPKWVALEDADPNYVHPEKAAFDEQEWRRRLEGYWFYNNGVPTYITGLYYFYLCHWKLKFEVKYRETNKEVFYWLQFLEEDPDCYGGCYNTKRRDGKSSILGCWVSEPILRTHYANGGMQDRTDKHAKKFFRENIMNPFRKLIPTFQPEYDTSTTQKEELLLRKRIKRGEKISSYLDDESDLESRIDCRASEEEAYDGDKLMRYIVEEPGKKSSANIYERHDVVKWCCYDNGEIIGKMLYATTVELEEGEEESAEYKRLYYDSDYNERPALNQTKSGLYSSFMPAYYADHFDDFGHPLWESTKAKLDARRESLKNDPKKYASFVRKFPYTIAESFYTANKKSLFNVAILEDRRAELDVLPNLTVRGNFKWKDGIKDSGVWFDPDPNGHWKVAYLFENPEDANRVRFDEGIQSFKPMNMAKFRTGADPVQHGIVNDMGKASTPVGFTKRLFDAMIDPVEDLLVMAKQKYPYKTNKYVCMWDFRPPDPKTFYEGMILQCFYYGTQLHVENQKNAIITYFDDRGYSDFIMKRPEATVTSAQQFGSDGTPATPHIIQQYTEELITYIEYFGHTIPFVELIESLIGFDPKKTQFYDHAVAAGFTELAGLKRIREDKFTLTMEDLMPLYDAYGNIIN